MIKDGILVEFIFGKIECLQEEQSHNSSLHDHFAT